MLFRSLPVAPRDTSSNHPFIACPPFAFSPSGASTVICDDLVDVLRRALIHARVAGPREPTAFTRVEQIRSSDVETHGGVDVLATVRATVPCIVYSLPSTHKRALNACFSTQHMCVLVLSHSHSHDYLFSFSPLFVEPTL